MTRSLYVLLFAVGACWAAPSAVAQLPDNDLPAAETGIPSVAEIAEGSNFVPYDAVTGHSAIAAPCACGGCGGGYDRCGCNQMLFPWISGPGNCDQWCVGPHWQVEAAGLMLFRDDVDWDRIAAAVGAAPDYFEQFGHGPGARVSVTGYNDQSFGMQVVYEGINEWAARSEFPAVGSLRAFDYKARLNSVEVNFLRRNPSQWQWFGGFRYVEIDEDFIDFTTVDKVIPLPADPPAAPAAFVDSGDSFLLKNQLIGFQLGGFRDTWMLGPKLTVRPFANGGLYCNRFKRTDVNNIVTTTITGDDLATPDVNEFSQTRTLTSTVVRRDFTNMAFLGEAGVSAVWQVTPCIALRGGYQVLFVDGVMEGLDAFFVNNLATSTLIYHGAHFGLEYRR